MAEQSWNEDSRIQLDKAEIIHKEESAIIMEVKKSVFIVTIEQVCSQPSPDVNSLCLPVLRDRK